MISNTNITNRVIFQRRGRHVEFYTAAYLPIDADLVQVIKLIFNRQRAREPNNLMDCGSLKGPLPRLSGFLKIKKEKAKASNEHISLSRTWKERWCLLVVDNHRIILQYFRHRGAPAKQIFIDVTQYPVPLSDFTSHDRCCFRVTSIQSEQILLVATSELQMRSWMSCLRSGMDDATRTEEDKK